MDGRWWLWCSGYVIARDTLAQYLSASSAAKGNLQLVETKAENYLKGENRLAALKIVEQQFKIIQSNFSLLDQLSCVPAVFSLVLTQPFT
ncbi:hypothetical protein Pelo_19942 [Pelomyxa schiedti]|nr:hypothetical protein Pelo_19942 [Pelomyxa schiedti]